MTSEQSRYGLAAAEVPAVNVSPVLVEHVRLVAVNSTTKLCPQGDTTRRTHAEAECPGRRKHGTSASSLFLRYPWRSLIPGQTAASFSFMSGVRSKSRATQVLLGPTWKQRRRLCQRRKHKAGLRRANPGDCLLGPFVDFLREDRMRRILVSYSGQTFVDLCRSFGNVMSLGMARSATTEKPEAVDVPRYFIFPQPCILAARSYISSKIWCTS